MYSFLNLLSSTKPDGWDTVFWVILAILLGFIAYLFYIDKRLCNYEKKRKNQN